MKDQISLLAGAVRPEAVTVSRKELLVDGSDGVFRQTLHTLMAISNNSDTLKSYLGELIGVSGPQHEIFMLIARANGGRGISVGDVARLIKKTSPFVVNETNKLQRKGFIAKTASLEDRRRVTLQVTRNGRQALDRLAPYQREVNDKLFDGFSHAEFLLFSQMLEKLLDSSERAVDAAEAIIRDRRRQRDR